MWNPRSGEGKKRQVFHENIPSSENIQVVNFFGISTLKKPHPCPQWASAEACESVWSYQFRADLNEFHGSNPGAIDTEQLSNWAEWTGFM